MHCSKAPAELLRTFPAASAASKHGQQAAPSARPPDRPGGPRSPAPPPPRAGRRPRAAPSRSPAGPPASACAAGARVSEHTRHVIRQLHQQRRMGLDVQHVAACGRQLPQAAGARACQHVRELCQYRTEKIPCSLRNARRRGPHRSVVMRTMSSRLTVCAATRTCSSADSCAAPARVTAV